MASQWFCSETNLPAGQPSLYPIPPWTQGPPGQPGHAGMRRRQPHGAPSQRCPLAMVAKQIQQSHRVARCRWRCRCRCPCLLPMLVAHACCPCSCPCRCPGMWGGGASGGGGARWWRLCVGVGGGRGVWRGRSVGRGVFGGGGT